MAGNPYGTQKIVHHPDAVDALRDRRPQPPIQIHFMPSLACNHACTFCSYGHRKEDDGPEQRNWKNMQLMSEASMPRAKMLETVACWRDMGVKCVELTGGGEPLVYPHVDEFFRVMSDWRADLALVTNGTALTEERADLFGKTVWKWARVSVDAGSMESYCDTRRVGPSHWKKAWAAVRRLAERKSDPEQRVGVGYVVDRNNWGDVYQGCALAKEHGADNVRISAAFTPQSLDRFPPGAVEEASRQGAKAKRDLEDETFQVNNLFDERVGNLRGAKQDYKFCGTKEVLCVVGGDQNVYTCCTLAFNRKGLVGSVENQSFRDLWESVVKTTFFARHDARRICDMECLYERRNKRILELASMDADELESIRAADRSIHRNFI